jgi:CRP-like cAMP-binding protein
MSDSLRARPPFDRMAAEEVHRIARTVEAVALRRGKALYYQGDRPGRCWLLLEGRVRGVMYRSDETTVELGVSEAGDWLGMAELLLDAPCLNDALASETTELAAFSRAAFERLLSLPGMRQFFLRDVARRYYTMHSRVELATPLDRLVRVLVDRYDQAGGASVRATQDELAEATGSSRETVNRHLGRLAAQGLVAVGRGEVRIVDIDALRRLAE